MKIFKSQGCTAFYTMVDNEYLKNIPLETKKEIVLKLAKKNNKELIEPLLYGVADIIHYFIFNEDKMDMDKWDDMDYHEQIDYIPKLFYNNEKKLSLFTYTEKCELLNDIIIKCNDDDLDSLINTMIELVECDEYYSDDEPCDSCGDYVSTITINI